MKKIVISTLPNSNRLEKRFYPVDGNSTIQVDEPIYFAVNSALANKLQPGDDVKVVLVGTSHETDSVQENAQKFMEELHHFNKVGANIREAIITKPFDETKVNFQKLYKDLLDELEDDAELFVDITYGLKTSALLIFSVIHFAEKFFGCSIGNIVYSKVQFATGTSEIVAGSEKIYDITPLYTLNRIVDVIESPDGKRAVQTIKTLFEE